MLLYLILLIVLDEIDVDFVSNCFYFNVEYKWLLIMGFMIGWVG